MGPPAHLYSAPLRRVIHRWRPQIAHCSKLECAATAWSHQQHESHNPAELLSGFQGDWQHELRGIDGSSHKDSGDLTGDSYPMVRRQRWGSLSNNVFLGSLLIPTRNFCVSKLLFESCIPGSTTWSQNTYKPKSVAVNIPWDGGQLSFGRSSFCQSSRKASSYRESIVEKGTSQMVLSPKKWRKLLPSKEVLNAVYALRRVKRNPEAVQKVMKKHVTRLLKLDMMLVLFELQRLDEWRIAHQVFYLIRKEPWYRPDVSLFQKMVQVFGKNKQIQLVEKMFEDLEDEGLTPDDSIRRELLRSYVICGRMDTAIQVYKDIVNSLKDQAARSILFHGLTAEQKEELAQYEKAKGIDWSFVEKQK